MSELITTYLQDHHAGSIGGLETFERVAGGHDDPRVREVVGGLVEQIREDKAALERLLEQAGGSTSTVKDSAAWAAEKVGRLKPNERIVRRSPLSNLLELEMLILGVHGKLLLWQALVELADPRLDGALLRDLVARAEAQERTLVELRLTQVGTLREE